MPQHTITFRSQTSGGISDLIQDEGLVCQSSQNIISFLAGALLDYREEGVELYPRILYCQNADTFLGSLPGCVRYQIGRAPLTSDSGKRILKECATLAVDGWYIWIQRLNDNELAYGVFSYLMLPTTLPLAELMSLLSGDFAILVRKSSRSTIDIQGSKGNSLSLLFSTSREESLAGDPIGMFAAKCSEKISGNEGYEDFLSYYKQMLARVLESSHGTILVCGAPEVSAKKKGVQDAIGLNPPLDFLTAFRDYQSLKSADSILKLQALEALLRGFVSSDGIVAFDDAGAVFAYRMFYKAPSSKGSPKSTKEAPLGGARRRAFEGVKALIPETLSASLFRSQDGLMIFAGPPNA